MMGCVQLSLGLLRVYVYVAEFNRLHRITCSCLLVDTPCEHRSLALRSLSSPLLFSVVEDASNRDQGPFQPYQSTWGMHIPTPKIVHDLARTLSLQMVRPTRWAMKILLSLCPVIDSTNPHPAPTPNPTTYLSTCGRCREQAAEARNACLSSAGSACTTLPRYKSFKLYPSLRSRPMGMVQLLTSCTWTLANGEC